MNNQDIIQVKEDEYGSSYKEHVLSIYKMYMEGIDKAIERRHKTNDFFLALNTGILAFLGVMSKVSSEKLPIYIFVASIFGVIISTIWLKLITAYRNINRGKYKVLHILEEQLPIVPYRLEWDVLSKGMDKKVYIPITSVEIGVPFIFMIFYLLLVLATYSFAFLL